MNNWFQSEECYNFYSSLPFLEAFKFEVKRGKEVKGRIVGYIQKDGGKVKQFFSRRAIINGGPMLTEDIMSNEIELLLTNCINCLKHKVIYIEIRNFNDYSIYRQVFEQSGLTYEPHFNFLVDTSSLEMVEQNLGKSRKRDIKSSIRQSATICENPSFKDIEDLYKLLKILYQTKVKTPLFSFEFFKKLFDAPFSKFITIEYQEQVIGGTVLVFDRQKVYEWFACGIDGVYKGIHPSTLATYGGIKYATENDIKCFDMMGAGSPSDGGYGVRDFKAKFGGELVEYGRFKYVCNKPLYLIGTLAIKILKKLR